MRPWAVILVVLSLSSSASASWFGLGGMEPSTDHDRRSTWMFAEPDRQSGQPSVYFQAFQSVEGTSVNPNVAATDGRWLIPGPVHHRALLGFWKDCNEDGYIGQAESALLDYHASTPFNQSLCPGGSIYNDGQWVSEMIGIGMVDPCESAPDRERTSGCSGVSAYHENERAFYADGTMVWGDVGAPGTIPPAECPLAPLPPTTTSGTGPLLSYADCQNGRRVAASVNGLDGDGALGLRFEDPEHPEHSTSLLNAPFPVTLFGGAQGPGMVEHDSGARAATVWDCRSPRAFGVTDPTGGSLESVVVEDKTGRLTGKQEALPVVGAVTVFHDEDGNPDTPGVLRIPVANDGHLLWSPLPTPSLDDPTGSWWDTLEHGFDGPRGDCDDSTPTALRGGSPGPIVEGGDAQVDAAQKSRSSFAFTWYDGHRGLNGNIDFLLGPTTPSDGGLTLFRHGRGGVGPLWSADSASANEPQLLHRGSLDPSPSQTWTYYAKLGSNATIGDQKLPSGGSTGAYGSEACGSETTGVHGGWVCDASLWWRDALGRDIRPRYSQGAPYGPVPGERYHLRDVDCYDGHIGIGVYASLGSGPKSRCS